MSNNILIKDNFFDGIDILRAIALSSDYMYHLKTPQQVGWIGYRTWELSYLDNPIIEECCDNILKEFSDFYNITGYSMQKFFHITYEVTKLNRMRAWHTDHSMEYAGLIYLNPNPPSTAGTTIFKDGKKIEVENKYNRLVGYNGNLQHGPTDDFGDTKESGRMCLVFFLNKKEILDPIIENIEWFRTKSNQWEYFKF